MSALIEFERVPTPCFEEVVHELTDQDYEEIAELAEDIEIELPADDERCPTPQPNFSELLEVEETFYQREVLSKCIAIRYWHKQELINMADREEYVDEYECMIETSEMAKNCYYGRRYKFSRTEPLESSDSTKFVVLSNLSTHLISGFKISSTTNQGSQSRKSTKKKPEKMIEKLLESSYYCRVDEMFLESSQKPFTEIYCLRNSLNSFCRQF